MMFLSLLLPCMQIVKGDFDFQQDIDLDCASHKHLGHFANSCYLANLGLRKPQQPVGLVQSSDVKDKGEKPKLDVDVYPRWLMLPGM